MEFLDAPGVGPPSTGHCSGDVCITCSDTAVAVTVLEVRPDDLALVETGAGPPEEVSIALVDARVGDVVLVHAGEAIALVSSPPDELPPGGGPDRP